MFSNSPTPHGLWLLKLALFLAAAVCVCVSVASAQSESRQESVDPYFRPRVAATPPIAKPELSHTAASVDDTAGPDSRSDSKKLEPLLGERPANAKEHAESGSQANAAPRGDWFEPGKVLAIVGGEPIFFSDLALEATQIIDQFIADAPAHIKEQEKSKLIPRLLPKYIDSKLMYVEFKRGLPKEAKLKDIIESAEQQFDEMVLPTMLENAKVDSAAMLDAQFRAQGSSLRKMRRSWSETELAKYALREKMDLDPEVAHREMFEVYLKNKEDYKVPARAKWEQIMVRFSRFPTRAEAKQALAKMGNEIVYGASFAAVAKRDSHGYLAEEGGHQGWTNKGSLRAKELETALFEIEVNRLSNIIETEQGYHIVRVIERTPEGYIPFAEAQVEIRKKLVAEKRKESLDKFVASLRDKIPVEILDDEKIARQADASWK